MSADKKVIFVDIDETICFHDHDHTGPGTRDYNDMSPNYENIKKINKLYDDGHEIVYWTARGCKSGIDWYDFTEKQLDKWGVKYHKLKSDQPFYDLFVEDKSLRIEEIL